MKKFEHTALWALLDNAASSTDGCSFREDKEGILDEFTRGLADYCREENDLVQRTRTLQFIYGRIEARMKELFVSGLHSVLARAIASIECELDIARMALEHRGQFAAADTCESSPGIVLFARWNGTVAELLEYMIPLHAAGKLARTSGEPMSWADIIKLIETVYGIKIPGPYDRKTKILSRYKKTAFLDRMRNVFIEETKKSIR